MKDAVRRRFSFADDAAEEGVSMRDKDVPERKRSKEVRGVDAGVVEKEIEGRGVDLATYGQDARCSRRRSSCLCD